MKRIFIFLLTIFAISIECQANKALSIPIQLNQSDGTIVKIFLHGDEHFHWATTVDDVIVVRTEQGCYIGLISDNGELTASTQLAHENTARTPEEKALVETQMKKKKNFFNAGINNAKKIRKVERIGNATPSYFPHIGSPKALVILVNYADTMFSVSDPKKVFDQYLNGDELIDYGHGETKNIGSVKQYFNAMSFGAFTPQFDVYGPVTVSKGIRYYGGTNSSGTDDSQISLIREACQLADSMYNEVDFAQYDSNNDGYIDLVYIIYAGFGQSTGGYNYTIWPKSGSYSTICTIDGKKVSRYGVNNELNLYREYYQNKHMDAEINGIGLFVHEFSHTLGLSDHYTTSSTYYVNNQEMELWDVMDGGIYNEPNGYGRGTAPASYTAWEREAMGWLTIQPLTESQQGIEIRPINDQGTAYKILNEDQSNGHEYLVIENIQKNGWNIGARGHGMLVYHVNYNRENVGITDLPNNRTNPGMTVVPADSLLLSYYVAKQIGDGWLSTYMNQHSGDPFPGTKKVTKLNDSMKLPNFKFYHTTTEKNGKVGKGLANISEDTSTGIVTFDFIADTLTGIQLITKPSDEDHRIYSLDGIYVGNSKQDLQPGIYIQNKKKVIIR